MARRLAAAVVAGMLTWGAVGVGIGARAAATTVVTAGNLQLTFGGASQKGALGDVGGYASLGFNFETGQAGMFGDVQIGQDSSGNPTLAGDLAQVPANDALPAAPTSATLTVSAGESLLVFDSAGNYVLVQITNVTSQAVYFTYTMQTAASTVQPPQTQAQGQATQAGQGQGSSTAPASGSAQTQTQTQTASPPVAQPPAPSTAQGTAAGVYTMSGNCLTVADSAGAGGLGVGVVVSPMFPDQTIAAAEQNKELLLNVAISAPSDVTSVTAKQSGQVGGFPFTENLYGYGDNGNDWTFSMQQTDLTETYQILITSQTLASAGIANPGTGVTEIDWSFNTSQGCGSGGAQTIQAGAAQSPGQSTGSQTTAPTTPGSAAASPVTIDLIIGSSTATVDGQSQPLAVPAEIDAAGRTMVPFRWLGDAIGATVNWDAGNHVASYQLGSMDVAIGIGSSTAFVNGHSVALDAPAIIVDGSTLVPARFVSQALGASVAWDASSQTVTITYPAPSGG